MTTTETTSNGPTRKRERSPSYPGIDLEEAIAKARVLYTKAGRSETAINTVAGWWDYKPGSGSVNIALSALRKFGLADYVGSGPNRKVKLTERALRILRDTRPVSPERDRAIREAALEPSIYKHLLERVRDGSDDDALKAWLKFDRSFADGAVDALVSDFRHTMTYAKVTGSDKVSEDDGDKEQDLDPFADDTGSEMTVTPLSEKQGRQSPTPPSGPGPAMRIPLIDDAYVDVRWSSKLTEDQWKQWQAILEVMKPGIIAKDDATPK